MQALLSGAKNIRRFEVRSTFSSASGTRVHQEFAYERRGCFSIAFDRNQAKLSMIEVPDARNRRRRFRRAGQSHATLDMIIQSTAQDGKTRSLLRAAGRSKQGAGDARTGENRAEGQDVCTKRVSAGGGVGVGMRSHPGVAARMFKALGRQERSHPDDLDLRDQNFLCCG